MENKNKILIFTGIILLLSMFIIFLNPISSFLLTNFNNTLSSENITFNEKSIIPNISYSSDNRTSIKYSYDFNENTATSIEYNGYIYYNFTNNLENLIIRMKLSFGSEVGDQVSCYNYSSSSFIDLNVDLWGQTVQEHYLSLPNGCIQDNVQIRLRGGALVFEYMEIYEIMLSSGISLNKTKFIRYLSIPKKTNITSATLNLSSYSNLKIKWQNDSSITDGLFDIGNDNYPEVIEILGVTYLIATHDLYETGTYKGFNWSGTKWQNDSSILNGITDIGDMPMTIFNISSSINLIHGRNDGLFNGFTWNGSGWDSNSTIISGLTDVGGESSPSVFYLNNELYLISGKYNGQFDGYVWNGSGWDSNSTIISGLTDVGGDSNPEVFNLYNITYLISGRFSPILIGFNWSGSQWQSDSSIIDGTSTTYESSVNIFEIDNIWYMLQGDSNGDWSGYNKSYLISNTHILLNNIHIWNQTGIFNKTNNKTNDFSSILNTALNSGSCDCSECIINGNNCDIPLLFYSETEGLFEYSDININYEHIPITNLISPENNSYSPKEKTFLCSVTNEETKIKNLTFYLWNSTNDLINTSFNDNVSNYYKFDKDGDWVNISSSDSLNISNGTNGISIEAWFKLDDYTAYRRLLAKSHTTNSLPYTMYGLLMDSSTGFFNDGKNAFRMEVGSGGLQHFVRSTTSLEIGVWYHIIGTYNNSDGAKLYLNGNLDNSSLYQYNGTGIKLVSTINTSNIDTNNNPLSIGGSGYGGVGTDFINGSIAEIRIFNRSLSSIEVEQLYNYTRFNESTHISNGLIGEYHFENYTNLLDSSIYGNNGTLFGDTKLVSEINLNFTNNFNYSGSYHWNCLAYNTKNYSNWFESNYTLNVELENPIITLNFPSNNGWVNYENITFNYTPEHSTQTIETCEFYVNSSGTFELNLSDSSITEDIINSFQQNFTDGSYLWNVWCNTSTSGASSFSQLGNRTFNIDTINPSMGNITITTTAGSQTFNFNSTSSDSFLSTCKYSIYNSSLDIDGLNNNVSFTCNTLTSATTSSYGNFIFRAYATDLASNENYAELNFTTSPTTGGVVTGGGGTTIIIGEKGWIMQVVEDVQSIDFGILGGSRRNFEIQFKNIGEEERIITLSCDDGEVCDYITYENVEIILPVLKDVITKTNFEITLPENFEEGDYIFNIIGTDDNSLTGSITLNMKVGGEGFISTIFIKLFLRMQNGFPYLALFFILLVIFFFIFIKIIPKEVPVKALWVTFLTFIITFIILYIV